MFQQNEREINTAYFSLQTLMNINEQFTIKEELNYQLIPLSMALDTSLMINSPFLKLFYQQAVIAEQNKK